MYPRPEVTMKKLGLIVVLAISFLSLAVARPLSAVQAKYLPKII
jgi:hypothetical protein